MSNEYPIIDAQPEPAVDLDFTMGNGDKVHVTISGFTQGEQVLQVMEALGSAQVKDQIIEQFATAGDPTVGKIRTYLPGTTEAGDEQ